MYVCMVPIKNLHLTFIPLVLMTWTSVDNRFAIEIDSSVQNIFMSAVTLLIVNVAMSGEVDLREKLKTVLFSVSGSNNDDPP